MSPLYVLQIGYSVGEMRLVFKIGKIAALVIVAIIVILFTSSLFVQDKVAGIILKSLNKNLLT